MTQNVGVLLERESDRSTHTAIGPLCFFVLDTVKNIPDLARFQRFGQDDGTPHFVEIVLIA